MVNLLNLAKGEILIREDDASNSLYYLQSGSLRVFMKKGKGFVELGVINQGAIVGELSFFDNLRRSASVEALRDCEVVEIPRFNFDEYLSTQPAWASALLKTMSNKVRGLTDRVRELESNSTVTRIDEDKKTVREHEFLLARDVMKMCSALLLCGSLRGTRTEAGSVQFPAKVFQVLAANMNAIPFAKVTSFLDLLKELGLLEVVSTPGQVLLTVRDVPTLERFLFWLGEDMAKTTTEKLHLSKIGLQLGEAIWAMGILQKCPDHQEYVMIDLPKLAKELEARHGNSSKLYLDTFGELLTLKLGRDVKADDGGKEYEVHVKRFLAEFPMLRIRAQVDWLNAKKRGESSD